MEQKVEYIPIENLILWTENPRDPIDENATDQDIVDKAIEDRRGRWSLKKLAKEMGDYYDFSELPTVVYHNGKPIVYDGNRRVILGKIKNGLVKNNENFKILDYPDSLPCNICSEEVALNNVLRKHGGSGSWTPLDRDIFLHRFMQQPKSLFLKLDESTGIITNNPFLNQGFVKKEIFNSQKFEELGFDFDGDVLTSKHSQEQAQSILDDVIKQVETGKISTRENRGQLLSLLNKNNRDSIEKNKSNSFNTTKLDYKYSPIPITPRKTKRTKPKELEIFGGDLYLKTGDVSNLYRDILDLHIYFIKNKSLLSETFSALIRMSLRLICETASKDHNSASMEKYIKENFANAKKQLNTDQKTTLSNLNVTETSIIQLLHTGAHNYSSSNNFPQTIAISIIIGAMLTLTHGKK